MYDAANRTEATKEDCEALIGKRGTLTLTGKFVKVNEHDNGPFLIFEVDERWGFPPGFRLGMDKEAFDI